MWPPVLVLIVLSPVLGELLSGSAPPAEFFNPLGLAFLLALYGGGAVLARDLAFRWRGGWLTLLLLAVAYGVVEEGIACKSFFDPHWGDLGKLGVYGRMLGVNWVWVALLTAYHAVVSVMTPIALVEMAFPGCRGKRWTSDAVMALIAVLLFASVLLIYLFISKYRPPDAHLAIAILAAVTLGVLARVMAGARRGRSGRPAGAGWFFLVGFLGTVAMFFLGWVMPNTRVPASVTLVLMLMLCLVATWLVREMSGGGGWGDRHRFWLVSGVLLFFVLLAPVQEFDGKRTDNTAGMTLVGVTTAVALAALGWRVNRRRSRLAQLRGT